MGSPIVFQTAPPQPASNARMTCPAVLLGGPEASQNGFGLVMPANFTVRSAIIHLRNERHLGRRATENGPRGTKQVVVKQIPHTGQNAAGFGMTTLNRSHRANR